MSKNTEHFETKFPHTEIKHKLLSSAIESSLAISNSYKNPLKENRQFSYMDLYAGCGEFDDESKGSPAIAYELIEKQLSPNSNNINKVAFIAAEQCSENAAKLKENMNKSIANSSSKNIIELTICDKSWEDCRQNLEDIIITSKWGFIFVDPFSTELHLGELKKLISKNIFYKDILILINNNAHERILGRSDKQSLAKISQYFDVDIRLIEHLKGLYLNDRNFNNAQVIQFLIRKTFEKLNKDFVLNVAIPRTRDGKLEESNRFYLTLITSSLGVANQYLSTYAELLGEKEEKKLGGQLNLFSTNKDVEYFELKNKIQNIIEKKKKISLYELVLKLFNSFYSWRNANKTQIPTITNIRNVLNQLALKNKIKLECPTEYYKKNEIEILSTKLQNKSNLKEILIINE